MRLPLELRQHIYELAMTGRVISLRLVEVQTDAEPPGRLEVRSACYEPLDPEADGPNRLDVPADAIPTGLLLSCRQVYLEALPILHQGNTFHFHALELEDVVLAALGRYCLPDIRSVYLVHSSCGPLPWSVVFGLLHKMRLDTLVFEFGKPKNLRFDIRTPVLLESWPRDLLAIRTLRRFEIFFTNGEPPEDDVQWLRDFMVGPGADERYRVLQMAQQEIANYQP
ncbi:hypothetical protein DFH09DRAFT_1119240 [Mycena vulgaris]|nr:hypothetical protein DFH09DRAFT_1119240 [Mycena vulgaris]